MITSHTQLYTNNCYCDYIMSVHVCVCDMRQGVYACVGMLCMSVSYIR